MKVLKSSWKFFQTNAWTLTHFLERKDCLILFKLHYVRVCTRTVHTWRHVTCIIATCETCNWQRYIVRVYSLYELWQSCTVIFRVSIMSLNLHRTKPYISSHNQWTWCNYRYVNSQNGKWHNDAKVKGQFHHLNRVFWICLDCKNTLSQFGHQSICHSDRWSLWKNKIITKWIVG